MLVPTHSLRDKGTQGQRDKGQRGKGQRGKGTQGQMDKRTKKQRDNTGTKKQRDNTGTQEHKNKGKRNNGT